MSAQQQPHAQNKVCYSASAWLIRSCLLIYVRLEDRIPPVSLLTFSVSTLSRPLGSLFPLSYLCAPLVPALSSFTSNPCSPLIRLRGNMCTRPERRTRSETRRLICRALRTLSHTSPVTDLLPPIQTVAPLSLRTSLSLSLFLRHATITSPYRCRCAPLLAYNSRSHNFPPHDY